MSREALSFPPENGPRTIWVFTLDIDPAEVPKWEKPTESGPWPLIGALGTSSLVPSDVEVFTEERISEYGLVRYLTEASGMSMESVAPDAPTLESISGVVALVHSKGVKGVEGHFDPAHPAHFVGRYTEPVRLTAAVPVEARELTRGVVASPDNSQMRFPWRIISLTSAAIAVLALILWSLL